MDILWNNKPASEIWNAIHDGDWHELIDEIEYQETRPYRYECFSCGSYEIKTAFTNHNFKYSNRNWSACLIIRECETCGEIDIGTVGDGLHERNLDNI